MKEESRLFYHSLCKTFTQWIWKSCSIPDCLIWQISSLFPMLHIVAHLSILYPCWQCWCSCSNTAHQRNSSQASGWKKADVTLDFEGCQNHIFDKPVTCHEACWIEQDATVNGNRWWGRLDITVLCRCSVSYGLNIGTHQCCMWNLVAANNFLMSTWVQDVRCGVSEDVVVVTWCWWRGSVMRLRA